MLDLAFKLSDQIVGFWNFFVVFATVLVGWVFSRKTPWPPLQKTAIAIGFIIFIFFNLIGLTSSHKALQVVVNELNSSNSGVDQITDTVVIAMKQRFTMRFWPLDIVFHIVVDVILLWFILVLSGKPISK